MINGSAQLLQCTVPFGQNKFNITVSVVIQKVNIVLQRTLVSVFPILKFPQTGLFLKDGLSMTTFTVRYSRVFVDSKNEVGIFFDIHRVNVLGVKKRTSRLAFGWHITFSITRGDMISWVKR